MASRTTKVHIDGLREVDEALGLLKPSTGKAVLRRVGKKRLQPIADTAKSLAPDDPATKGAKDLKETIGVGTRLTKRQRRVHKKMFASERASVELFAGAGGQAKDTQQEFGNSEHAAQPFMRPAWDMHKNSLLDGIGKDLWAEIEKSVKRARKKKG